MEAVTESEESGTKRESARYFQDVSKENGSGAVSIEAQSMEIITTPVNSMDRFPELVGVKDGLLRQRMAELKSRGESISIMCVGDNGLGKSTLLSNLFAKRLTEPNMMVEPSPATQKITETSESLEIDGFPFLVKLIDTPGYGDFLDTETCFKMITNYVDRQMDGIYQSEQSEKRSLTLDWFTEGIDVVLYFIAPHRLKKVDIELMKRLCRKVTIIPILAKADSMTTAELAQFRSLVIDTLAQEGISTFQEPYAVVASSLVDKNNEGKIVVGRKYPWGFVEAENETYSDLPALRRCLVYDGLSLLHATKRQIYESRRQEKIRFGRVGPLRRLFRFVVRTAVQVTLIAVLLPLAREKLILKDKEKEEPPSKAPPRRFGR